MLSCIYLFMSVSMTLSKFYITVVWERVTFCCPDTSICHRVQILSDCYIRYLDLIHIGLVALSFTHWVTDTLAYFLNTVQERSLRLCGLMRIIILIQCVCLSLCVCTNNALLSQRSSDCFP